MFKSRITRSTAVAVACYAFGFAGISAAAAEDERQYLYCVTSASSPGGKAYFTKVYPGSWEQSPQDEEAYHEHVAKSMDQQVERSTTYCYALDSFDEAGLDRDEGVEQIREKGWEPVDVTWRP